MYLVYKSCDGHVVSFVDDTTLNMSNYDLDKLFTDTNKQIK